MGCDMSNECEFQKWCKMLIPVVAAASLGGDIEWLDHRGVWQPKDKTTGFVVEGKYRIKPRTIMIGDVEVPEPMRYEPEEGAIVWLVAMASHSKVAQLEWYGSEWHKYLLGNGIIHSSIDGAKAHADALISLSASTSKKATVIT